MEKCCNRMEQREVHMATLGNKRNTLDIVQKYQFDFRKKFGQNFLVDDHILDKIVDAADITSRDCVLEIGPGIGTLTQRLAREAGEVVAVEIDRNLIPILKETLQEYDNVTVLNEDILKIDIRKIAAQYDGKPLKVVANLPYYITTPIIMMLFESRVSIKSITVMVQKEVADRMRVGPGTKEYGALSLAVQYYAKPEVITKVPASCFMPRPNVDSTVIRLTCYEEPPVRTRDEEWLFAVIRASFNQRRKTLANALSNAGNIGVNRKQVEAVLASMGLSLTIRGETLTLEQFAELSSRLYDFQT